MNRLFLSWIFILSLFLFSCTKAEENGGDDNNGGGSNYHVVVVHVSGVSVTPSTLTLKVGESGQLKATVSPSNATDSSFSWSSNRADVASVDSEGNVTGISVGEALISAVTNDGKFSASCTVTVNPIPVSGVSLNVQELHLEKGESQDLVAIVTPPDATSPVFFWESANPDIATVSDYGTVTAVSGGNTTISVRSGESEATCEVFVTVPIDFISIWDDFVIEEGSSRKLDIHIYPEDATDQAIEWVSLNPSIAYVSEDGVLYGVSMGETQVGYKASGLSMTLQDVTVLSHIQVPGIVDLGLSSNWASFNLGATKPEEYGYYYAWGETEPKKSYTDDTYKYIHHGNFTSLYTDLIKYNKDPFMGYDGFTDWKATLENSDDAAWVKLGPQWHMPTLNDIYELCTRCLWSFTTRNGVKGLLVTGPSGNSIFLPAAGSMLNSSVGMAGTAGFYWGNQYDASFCCDAMTLWFHEQVGQDEFFEYYYYYRARGHTIRPVTNQAPPTGGWTREDIARTYKVQEYSTRDWETWSLADQYEMAISFKSPSSNEVFISNIWDSGSTVSGTYDPATGNILIENGQTIATTSTYGDVCMYGYDLEADDFTNVTLTFTPSNKSYRSGVFLGMVSAGVIGITYLIME